MPISDSTYDGYVKSRDLLSLIGTGSLDDLNNAKIIMKDRGAWASWWSFPIKDEAKELLKTPFYLYINTGGGVFPFKFKVQDYVDSKGNDGILSPWPEITEKRYVNKSKDGDSLSSIFKTWFKVTEIESINPPLKISKFEPAEGLSKENTLLHQSTFGYAYLRSEKPHLFYPPSRYDIEFAESQLRKPHDEVISLEAVLDQVENNFKKAGKPLKENWREITKRKIEIWFINHK